jgi:hypothetical protein
MWEPTWQRREALKLNATHIMCLSNKFDDGNGDDGDDIDV